MESDLIQHALTHVWCTPGMDKQVTLKLVRLTPERPAKGRLVNASVDVPLPDPRHYFHCYYIGQIPPDKLGVLPQQDYLYVWDNLLILAQEGNCLFNIYQYDCLEFCRGRCFIYTNERNEMLLAFETTRYAKAPADLLLRIYKNSYYESDRKGENEQVFMAAWTGQQPFQTFLEQVEFYKKLAPQAVFLTTKGLTYNGFVAEVMDQHSDVDMVYDPSIVRLCYYPYSALRSYYSTHHQSYQFLLDAHGVDDELFFYDDLDCYMITHLSGDLGLWRGVRLPLLAFEAIRQVTHQAWGVTVSVAETVRTRLFPDLAPEQLALCLVLRRSGYDRPLIYEAHKIQALYKLPSALREQALLGLDSLVEQWQASRLEASDYIQLMGLPPDQFTFAKVLSAYGYHGLCKALYDTPRPVQFGRASKCIGYQRGSAIAIEYDAQGLLVTLAIAPPGESYSPKGEETALVDFLGGSLTRIYYRHFDEDQVRLRSNSRFQVYTLTVATPPVFRNITDTPECFVDNGHLYFRVDRQRFHTFVLYETDIFLFHQTLSEDKGYLSCQITMRVTENLTVNKGVFCESVRVWLNNRALIENVDFLWLGPELRIISKRFLRTQGRPNIVTLIGYGLPPTTPLPCYQDTGFVQWHKLSFNARYDYRDDQLLRYIVGGRVKTQSQLDFAEDGTATLTGSVLDNGQPYQVQAILPLIASELSLNPDKERLKAAQIDNKVQNYLTLKLPEVQPVEVSAIPEKYPLYSPYLGQILYDRLTGSLHLSKPERELSDSELEQVLIRYQSLLADDPCLMESLDRRYLAIHPHRFQVTVTVTKEDYRLLSRIIALKLNNRVDLSFFLTIRDN